MAPSFINTFPYNNNLYERCQLIPGQRSLYEELEGYLRLKRYPFHMPGHKGNKAFMPPIPLESLDVTELKETDNLHDPTGCIAETERRISEFYGADESFLLVNGSTAGIIAAICATCGEGDHIAVDRRCHRSVHSGMVLSGARPIYFWPGQMDVPDAKAVIVTSPTYEGSVLDIASLCKKGNILIVDEAHGAHFPFHPIFPQSALAQGADIVVHSFHKTLPAFSQSAVVHIKEGTVNTNRLRRFLSYVQTSSPSYLMMAQVDYMLNLLWASPAYFERYVEGLLSLRKTLGGLLLPNDDMGKLLLCISNGHELEENHSLAFEMVMPKYTLAMTSVADTEEGFNRLVAAVKSVKGATYNPQFQNPDLPEVVLSPKEAMGKKTRKAMLSKSIGEISGSFIAPVPPGIPLIVPGERIKEIDIPDCEIEVLLL